MHQDDFSKSQTSVISSKTLKRQHHLKMLNFNTQLKYGIDSGFLRATNVQLFFLPCDLVVRTPVVILACISVPLAFSKSDMNEEDDSHLVLILSDNSILEIAPCIYVRRCIMSDGFTLLKTQLALLV